MTLERRPPASGRDEIHDTSSALISRVTPNGARSLSVRIRVKSATGKVEHVRLTYPKSATAQNLADARRWALDKANEVRDGDDPRQADVQRKEVENQAAKDAAERAKRFNFGLILDAYIERRLKKEKRTKSVEDIERLLDIYARPRWGDRQITEIRRSEVNSLLNDIYDRKIVLDGRVYGGPSACDHALAHIRACFNWFQTQDDEFVSPVVPGMAKTKPRERARRRVLCDREAGDRELKALWPLLPQFGMFGSIVKVLLLTGQRRGEVVAMSRKELTATGVWIIPAERYKTSRENVVPLTAEVLQIVSEQDKVGESPLVFTTTGDTPYSGFSKSKRELDAALVAEVRKTAVLNGENPDDVIVEPWCLHDLRRTAKTLMVRAGVRPDISERVLGHVIPGVEGIYDRYAYLDEKRDALEALVRLIKQIAEPAPAASTFLEAAE